MAQGLEGARLGPGAADVDVKTVRAAGGLIWRRDSAGTYEIALVHRPAYGDWSFPKGKLDVGETEAQAAIREVTEETGLRASLGRDLGTTSYVDGLGRPKTVRYWQMRAASVELDPSHEIDDAKWVSFEEARRMLSYPHDAQVLDRFAPPPRPTEVVTVLLIRHAKAGSRGRWTGPDDLRPLDDEGRRQAERLVSKLSHEEIWKLMSSPYVRCIETVEPLSAQRNLGIVPCDSLAEGTPGEEALQFILSEAGEGPVAMCTHGDVMMFSVGKLRDDGVPLMGDAVGYKKGSAWRLEVHDGAFVSARYLKPPKA